MRQRPPVQSRCLVDWRNGNDVFQKLIFKTFFFKFGKKRFSCQQQFSNRDQLMFHFKLQAGFTRPIKAAKYGNAMRFQIENLSPILDIKGLASATFLTYTF